MAELSGLNLPRLDLSPAPSVRVMRQGQTHAFTFAVFQYVCMDLERVTNTPPCLIIPCSCLCLPRSLLMTGMAVLPGTQVLTLMSPGSQLRFPPPARAVWFTMSPAADRGRKRQSWEPGERGVHCSPSLLTVSLYLWHLQHEQGRGVTLGVTVAVWVWWVGMGRLFSSGSCGSGVFARCSVRALCNWAQVCVLYKGLCVCVCVSGGRRVLLNLIQTYFPK